MADFKQTATEKAMALKTATSILNYFLPYKKDFTLIFGIMLMVTALQAILPLYLKRL